jgi:cytochrome d ubiquinol oxidase subunit II
MQLEFLWFLIVALMLATYVVLDGFDLGVGGLHLFLAKTEEERKSVIRSIGPVWDGNEVWLLASGGTLYFAFPGLYAVGFSGFYLALILVLWLFIFRATSIELRSHVAHGGWRKFWDRAFGISSLLLSVLLGAALGNVIRGVPLGETGWFFAPLWTDFVPGPNPGLLDWFTVLVGVFALAALLLHGALWLALKTEGELEARAVRLAGKIRFLVLGLFLACVAAGLVVQSDLRAHIGERPWLLVFPLLAGACLFGVGRYLGAGKPCKAFLASSLFLVAALGTFVFSLYPTILPSTTGFDASLTVANTAAPAYGLKVGLVWWVPGMALAVLYFRNTYRKFAGKVRPEEEGY